MKQEILEKNLTPSGKIKKDIILSFDQENYLRSVIISKKTLSLKDLIFCLKNNIYQVPTCLTCKKEVDRDINVGFRTFCSKVCANRDLTKINLAKKTNIDRYGGYKMTMIESQNKKKQTVLQKYGVDNIAKLDSVKKKRQTTLTERYGKERKTIREKYKNTIQEKYGVTCTFNSPEIKEKIKENNLKKFGFDHHMKCSTVQEKRNQTLLQNYGTTNLLLVPTIKEKYKCTLLKNYQVHYPLNNLCIKKKYLETLFKNYGVDSAFKSKEIQEKIRSTNLLKYNGIIGKSNNEIKVSEFISSLFSGITKIENDRTILSGKELDLYLPEYNLAIEYNGLMFHSIGKSSCSMFNNSDLETDLKNYHLDKTEKCQQQGIQLLHIFENEWLNLQKQDIWKSIIKSKLGVNDRVYARSLVIQPVSYQESCSFLNDNHLQGSDKSSIRLGLYNKEGELLSLMTFGKSRYDKKVACELLRFSTKKGITVVGGASKLFSHFKTNYLKGGESIVSYADRRHSNGNLYERLGFTFSHISEPNYFYFKENSYFLESRLQYQKHKLKDKLDIFNNTLSESENMYNNGYRKIYDSGNFVYIIKKE